MKRKLIKIKWEIFYFIIVALTASMDSEARPASYQFIPNIACDNPATLNTVKKADVILGDTYLDLVYDFSGSNGPLVGNAGSHEQGMFPYGRIAARLNPKLVLGVDVTSFFYGDIAYEFDSILNTISTGTHLEDYVISPRFSYQLTKSLAVGAALVIDRVTKAQLNFLVPPFNLVNKGEDWAYGYALGLSYTLNPATFVNLSYYSQLNFRINKSIWGPFVSPDFSATFSLPAIYTLNVIHMLNKKLTLSATARYFRWDVEQFLILKNTAVGGATFTIPLHYNNSWSGQLAGRYQLTDKWALDGSVIYESSPQSTAFRPPGLPAYSIWIFGLGPEYAINKALSVKLLYAHGFSNPPINTTGAAGPIVGNIWGNGDLIDLSLTYHM